MNLYLSNETNGNEVIFSQQKGNLTNGRTHGWWRWSAKVSSGGWLVTRLSQKRNGKKKTARALSYDAQWTPGDLIAGFTQRTHPIENPASSEPSPDALFTGKDEYFESYSFSSSVPSPWCTLCPQCCLFPLLLVLACICSSFCVSKRHTSLETFESQTHSFQSFGWPCLEVIPQSSDLLSICQVFQLQPALKYSVCRTILLGSVWVCFANMLQKRPIHLNVIFQHTKRTLLQRN